MLADVHDDPGGRRGRALLESVSDLPIDLVAALTVEPSKAVAYWRDPYFRAGALALVDRQVRPLRHDDRVVNDVMRRAVLVFKPDAVVGRKVVPAVELLRRHGFVVVASRTFRFTPLLTRELWRYQFNIATRDRAEVVDLLLTGLDSLVIVLDDSRWREGAASASCRLAALKGAADPSGRPGESLRSLLKAPTTLFNFVHVADEPADVVRELSLLELACGTDLLDRVVLDGEADPSGDFRVRLSDVESRAPAHDLDDAAAAARLRSRGCGGRDDGAVLPWRVALEWFQASEKAESSRWDVLALATAQIECNVPGLVPLVPTVTAEDWRRNGRVRVG